MTEQNRRTRIKSPSFGRQVEGFLHHARDKFNGVTFASAIKNRGFSKTAFGREMAESINSPSSIGTWCSGTTPNSHSMNVLCMKFPEVFQASTGIDPYTHPEIAGGVAPAAKAVKPKPVIAKIETSASSPTVEKSAREIKGMFEKEPPPPPDILIVMDDGDLIIFTPEQVSDMSGLGIRIGKQQFDFNLSESTWTQRDR